MIKEVVFSTTAEPEDVKIERLLKYLQTRKEINGIFYDLRIRDSVRKDEFILEYVNENVKCDKVAKLVMKNGRLRAETRFYEEIIRSILTNKPSKILRELFPGFETYEINGIRIGDKITGRVLVVGKKGLVLRNKYDVEYSKYKEFSYERGGIRLVIRVYGNNAKSYIKLYVKLKNLHLKEISVTERVLERIIEFADEGDEKSVLNCLLPGVPVECIKNTYSLNDRGNVFYVEYETSNKKGILRARGNDKDVKYENVPFEEGVYSVAVPRGFEGDVVSLRSVDELPDGVKVLGKVGKMFSSVRGYRYVYCSPDKWVVRLDHYMVEADERSAKLYVGDEVYEIDHRIADMILSAEMSADEVRAFLNIV